MTIQRFGGVALCFGALLLWGCLPVSKPVEDDPEPAETETSQPASGGFAGTWKREDTGAAFTVEDDGTTVKGTLDEGTYVWKDGEDKGKEIFSSYTFELKRKTADELEGSASFSFVDEDASFKSKWVVTKKGDSLSVVLEEISFDDEGKEADRKPSTKTFVFEPSAPAAAPAPAAGGYKIDLSTMVQAPGFMLVGEEAKVGFKVGVKMVAAGQTMQHTLAIVAETDEHWHLESNQGMSAYAAMAPEAKDMLMGVVVEKEGGKVVSAVLGKRGEKGKAIKVMAYTPQPKGEAPEGEDVEVEVPAGSYEATLYTTEVQGKQYKSWSGREGGDVEGVLLKTEGPDGKGYALKEAPSTVTLDLGESVEARKLVYDNGQEMLMTTHEVVKSLNGGMAKMVTATSTIEVESVAKDAKAELVWE